MRLFLSMHFMLLVHSMRKGSHAIYKRQLCTSSRALDTALKLILKLISIAGCMPSFELVRRRKYSERDIFTATVAVKIAEWLFLRLAVNIASAI